jgi:hypothetical protein
MYESLIVMVPHFQAALGSLEAEADLCSASGRTLGCRTTQPFVVKITAATCLFGLIITDSPRAMFISFCFS